jgi:hypothetical protein
LVLPLVVAPVATTVVVLTVDAIVMYVMVVDASETALLWAMRERVLTLFMELATTTF